MVELKRKIEEKLVAWKNSSRRKPLIVKGARQCGKTFSVLSFARQNYRNVIYLNFLEHPEYRDAFDGALDMDTLIMKLSSKLQERATFVPHETILVFDEIQDCPGARTALKFIYLDGRYDVIGTGSLLGVQGYGVDPRSIPVGYERHIEMHPLDFEEFLWAVGMSESVIDYLREQVESERSVDAAVHDSLREQFYRYAIVGGMPEAVLEFLDTKNLHEVGEIQKAIVGSYEADMIKYASGQNKAFIRECFRAIPGQLGKENKKFQYAFIRKGARASAYAGSLQWIEDAGIITRCYNVLFPELPLEGGRRSDVFKVYMNDPGLFLSMFSTSSADEILHGNFSIYKGAVFENLVAGMLVKNGHRLFYYQKDGGIELDFLIGHQSSCTPIEVKATTGNAKSLKTVFAHPEKYPIRQAFKIGDYNVGRTGAVLTLPHYAAFLIKP